jgi:DNA-binding NtrC family response regulator
MQVKLMGGTGVVSSDSEDRPFKDALIVDQEAPVRSQARSVLNQMGFRVAEREDAAEALSMIRTRPCFDVLVTDTAAVVDGVALADAFLKSCQSGRAVLTSHQADADAINLERNGAWTFVPKQFLPYALPAALERLGVATRRQRVILLAEDEPMVRNLVQLVLSKANHLVMSASNALEALQLSRQYPFEIDLLISDVKMPGVEGPQLAAQLRRERPGMPTLLMSGYVSGELRDFASNYDFIQKPFIPNDLLERINKLLERGESGSRGTRADRGVRPTG